MELPIILSIVCTLAASPVPYFFYKENNSTISLGTVLLGLLILVPFINFVMVVVGLLLLLIDGPVIIFWKSPEDFRVRSTLILTQPTLEALVELSLKEVWGPAEEAVLHPLELHLLGYSFRTLFRKRFGFMHFPSTVNKARRQWVLKVMQAARRERFLNYER